MEVIEGSISKDGKKVTFDVKGVTGPSCTDLTANLEAALGEVESRSCKAEYLETELVLQQTGKVGG